MHIYGMAIIAATIVMPSGLRYYSAPSGLRHYARALFMLGLTKSWQKSDIILIKCKLYLMVLNNILKPTYIIKNVGFL